MMNSQYTIPFRALIMAIMLVACVKEPLKPEIELTGIHLIEVENIEYVIDAISIDNQLLVTIIDKAKQYHFILLDENLNQVWIKTFEQINEPVQRRALQSVLYDGNNTISVFWADGLLRFDTQGNIIDFHFTFFEGHPVYGLNMKRAMIIENGNYLIIGSILSGSGNRGYSAVFDQNGSNVYSNFSAFSSKGDNILSDVVKKPNGEYLVTGLFDSDSPTEKPTSLIAQRLDAEGKIIETTYTAISSNSGPLPVATINGRGQGLVNNNNGTYSYFVNPKLNGSENSTLKCFRINGKGDILNTIAIPLPALHVSGGTVPYINKGVTTDSRSNIIGVTREAEGIPFNNVVANNENGSNLTSPHNSRYFIISQEGEVLKTGDINQELSNYFNVAVTRPDDKTFLVGKQLSFDNNFKLALFELKTP
ncbi:MAG: hypothetical protein JXQ87_05730 [Bacteroidia bacterium]